MAQSGTILNTPPPNEAVLEPKGGKLAAAWAAWFGALMGVTGDWVVKGALSAATLAISGAATIGGLLTAGSLRLTTAAVTPANGNLYAGDTGWTVPGAFLNGWADTGNTHFRKTSEGQVHVYVNVNRGAASATPAFTLPAGYRPATALQLPATDVVVGGLETCSIATNGDLSPCARGLGRGIQAEYVFYAGG